MTSTNIQETIVNYMWDAACSDEEKFTGCTTLPHAFEIIQSDAITYIKGDLGFVKFLPDEYSEALEQAIQQFIREFNEKFESFEYFMKDTYDVII